MGCRSSKSNTASKAHGKSAADRKQAWSSIRERLPRSKTHEAKLRRIELFKEFDKSGNGRLTLEEAYQGCVNVLHLDDFTEHLRDIVKRAFNKAKDMGNRVADAGSSEFVEFLEFRLMLCYIYDYFELTVMFDEIDATGNQLIDKKEFVKAAPKLQEWGLDMTDPEQTFSEIDANGSGSITFDEFAAWAASKRLSIDGDPDNNE